MNDSVSRLDGKISLYITQATCNQKEQLLHLAAQCVPSNVVVQKHSCVQAMS